MKQNHKALAVLAIGVFSGAAFAQSSASVYGVVDLSIAKSTGNSAQMSGNGKLNNGSSRLGFRGTEDLGGGLKASFNFEAAVNGETGAASANLFDRNANMSLGGNWGTLTMGRQLSTGMLATVSYDFTRSANYSVLANQFGYAGGTRNNSEFRYTTPDFKGFTADIGHVLKADNASANGETGVKVVYAGGPVSAALAYAKLGTGGKDWSLGAIYDFGAFKISASYQDPNGASRGYTLGGETMIGPVKLLLDVGRQTGDGLKNTDYVAEALYALSKRTFTYAALYREGTDGVKTFGVGVRHNF